MTAVVSSTRLDVPRAVTTVLSAAALVHLWAALTGLGRNHWIPPSHWAALAAAEVGLILVALTRPRHFLLRTFRLAAVALVALGAMILIPLPAVARRYHDQIPSTTVLSLAWGIGAFAAVYLFTPVTPRVRRRLPSNQGESGVALAVIVLSVLVFPIWLRSLGAVPLVQLLTGQATGVDIAIARQDALADLSSLPLKVVVGTIRKLYLLFAVGWVVADWARLRRWWLLQRSWRGLIAAIALVVASAFALVTTERAVLGQVLVVAVIAGLTVHGRQLTGKMVLALGVAVAFFPLVFGLVNTTAAGAENPVMAAVESVRRRVFFLPGDVMMQYFASFPERHEFLHGASIPKLSYLTGGSTFDLSGFVYSVAYQFDERLVGSANGSFLGVGWANFGLAGVVVWCIAAAVALLVLEYVLDVLPIRSSAAFRGLAAIQAVFLTSADVTRSILSFAPGLWDLMIVTLLVSLVYRNRATAVTTQARPRRAVRA